MVAVGKFVLYDGAVPPLEAGDYELTATQTLTSPQAAGLATETHRARLRVTSPRFKLPPDQVLSAFPPANSEGAYEARLPQIVIKRRTLPWERLALRSGDPVPAQPVTSNTPWLALVVIAEGEGELSVETPIAECVTAGVPMPGTSDVVKSVYLAVPRTTVQKVFPTVPDLRLLAHVREVNLDDTENAMGDDDGFMAVILANRLPQFDRVNCKPVRYIACLVNLEGQLHVLPEPTPPTPTFVATEFVFDATLAVATAKSDPDLKFMGVKATTTGSFDSLTSEARITPSAVAVSSQDLARREIDSALASARSTPTAKAGKAAQWASPAATTRAIAGSALSANSDDVAFVVRDAMKAGFRLKFEGVILEPTYRFPVLAHWSFTCNGAGSLDTIMQELDVGLLGTLPGPDAKPPRPACLPPVAGEGPPPAPAPRVPPEVAETGHVGLPHTTREGEARRAWFRGPFTPTASERRTLPGATGPTLAHVSDQLRLTIPDGREDLSLAIAFEIGRLLALSRPSVVAALMRWRREQYGAHRNRRLTGSLVADVGFARDALATKRNVDLGRLVGRGFIAAAAKSPPKTFGNARPIADPGRPIDYLSGEPIDDLAAGFAIDRERLGAAARTLDAGLLDPVRATTLGPADKVGEEMLAALDRGLDQAVRTILAETITERPNLDARGAPRPESDPLTDLIDRAAAKRREELK